MNTSHTSFIFAFALMACSSTTPPDTTADASTPGVDSSTPGTDSSTPGTDSSTTDSGGGDSSTGDSGGMVTLKVENYLIWCTVSVNGAATDSTDDTITIQVAPGTSVPLVADKKNSSFEWGYWVGNEADPTTHDTKMSTTVTVNKDTVVQACCPDAAGVNAHKPCPAPN